MRVVHGLMFVATALFALAPGVSAKTFDDAVAGFAFELPDDYSEKSRKHMSGMVLLTFESADGPTLVVTAIPPEVGFEDNEAIVEMLLASIEEGFDGRTTTRELSDLKLGGMPARWGWMEWPANASTMMVAAVGAVELDDLQIGFVAVMGESKLGAWQEAIEKSFFSFREQGEPVGAVTNKVAVTRVIAEPISVKPSVYEHPLFSVNLPAGWHATTLATERKAITLAKLKGPTGSVTVMCMSGLLGNQKSTEKIMYGSLSGSLPNLKKVSTDKIKAANGKKAGITRYKGQTVEQGKTVRLDAVTASIKNRKCWLGFIGISTETPNQQRVIEIMAVILSVH